MIFGLGLKDRQRDGESGAFAFLAFESDFAAVEFDAAFDDGEAESGSGNAAGILAAMKGFEEPLPIGGGNAQTLVAHREDRIAVASCEAELHRLARGRILHGIGEQVGQDVAQQAFVSASGRLAGDSIKVASDPAAVTSANSGI